jgi:hypothetical protein
MALKKDKNNETESIATAASDGTITPVSDAKVNIDVWNKG